MSRIEINPPLHFLDSRELQAGARGTDESELVFWGGVLTAYYLSLVAVRIACQPLSQEASLLRATTVHSYTQSPLLRIHQPIRVLEKEAVLVR